MDSINSKLDFLFHPRSIALAGITVTNPEHWTRTFLDALLEFKFTPIYLVNPKGNEIEGLKVYPRLTDIPAAIDYVISTVPAKAASGLVEECAAKGVKVVHFCTAGFGETGEEEGARLEAELKETARRAGIRVIGPNCMGIYCPKSLMSYEGWFPKEGGSVGYISQSGGNTTRLIDEVRLRGVRFSKVISYGNACDLNESDFLEYLAEDPETKIIAMYLEGVKDGRRFRRTLELAARKKPVVLLKGGITEAGARATAGHTGALAGSGKAWDSLCKQSGAIKVGSIEELADALVTLLFMPVPKGRRAALVGAGGGASVLITDQFAQAGLEVPPLPQDMKQKIREFLPLAGNIFRNPIDYSQSFREVDNIVKTTSIISQWDSIDFLVGFGFLNPVMALRGNKQLMLDIVDVILQSSRVSSKPMAVIVDSGSVSDYMEEIRILIQKCVSSGLPVYYSFTRAANAINLVMNYNQERNGRLGK